MRQHSVGILLFLGLVGLGSLAGNGLASPVYLISGGYVSCRTSWSKPTDTPLFQQAKPKLNPRAFVASCFGATSTSVWFQTDHGEPPRSGEVGDLVAVLRQRLVEEGPSAPLVVIEIGRAHV